ncbi:HAF repeat-containing PEP-CTERM protein [Microcystis aeruginosa]|uniref:Putative extracellular repeat, HAF family (Modular protein) n=1 Tax=Microcystis aeruginosa PCC 9443 TaxID=1160281 RepID=I4G814_MICAE|nr:HAF repeat-containing PEP-CTERM protein [Microcystis aeruginosa]CCI04075.1 putative extracellular repeat, HAF family (modular protein) [Microcystis aeruginosa PCC 9443]
MNKILANCISLGIGLGAIGVAFQAQAASFQGLGDLPGGIFHSNASGVSANGSVVVGTGNNGNEAFRWTQATGMVGLGDFPGGFFERSVAYGVSGNGSVVVGYGYSSQGREAFRWTQATGMVGLGDLPGGDFFSQAGGVSADGSVVVGGSSIVGYGGEAFRWTQATGMVGLGDLPGGYFSSGASGVSADGSVVVGSSRSANGIEAFRWTQATGMVGLGDLPGGIFQSLASAVSADGSVVVGIGNSTQDGLYSNEAFRWTQATGMVGLGDLPGGYFSSSALGVSADGSVVVGTGNDGNEAFIWNSAQGMRSLQQVLTNDYGLDLTGWFLKEANAISADGLTIVGSGTNPNGLTEAWIARLDGEPVSQPGTTPTNPLLPTPNPSNPDGFIFSGVIVGNNGLGTTNPIYFDPIVAVGYDYAVTGGPLFASVLIPNALPQGDSNFILELPGFGNYSLVAGTTFNLLGVNPLGFSDFRISDIDPAEMLDPTNPTAFVTGLTFTAAGTVTVTQNPIVQNTGGVSVPEPSNLLGLGLLGFGAFLTGKLNKKQAKKDF